MKHAGAQTIASLGPLLQRLRAIPGLVEKHPGVFYRSGGAFLHFHEDPAGIFADLKVGDDWKRLPAISAAHRDALVRRARALA